MHGTSINSLPEEILAQIIDYLDTSPPSERKARQEPSLELTSSSDTPLKHVCCVSKLWRRLGLHLLFKHVRLRLDGTSFDTRRQGASATYAEAVGDRYDTGLVGAIMDYIPDVSLAVPAGGRKESEGPHVTAIWALSAHHSLRELLTFIEGHDLSDGVASFALLETNVPSEKIRKLPRKTRTRDWRRIGAASFWGLLFSFMSPSRVVVLAPPTYLAYLTNAAIESSSDWAFSDMAFHLLELRTDVRIDQDSRAPRERPPQLDNLEFLPAHRPGFAISSVVYAQPWTHIAINEGSFLKAYETYEFFERGPPSLVQSINQCFMPRTATYQNFGVKTLPGVRSFTYTGIFPFATHIQFRPMLPYLEELDCQFAPDPNSGILDDKSRVGRAQLDDCWQELYDGYQAIVSSLATYNESFPNVMKFTCRDVRISGIIEELDDLFIPLCLPTWVEGQPGVFERQVVPSEVV